MNYAERQYAKTPRRRRHVPARTTDLWKYRDCLRLDFDFECGYCLAREAEVGPGDPFGGYQIDHFRPRSRPRFKNLQHNYSNLMWACTLCNRAKGDTWPSPSEEQRGIKFLNPVDDALGEHLFVQDEKVQVLDGSPQGGFFVEALRLNAAAHRLRRKRRDSLCAALRASEAIAIQLGAQNPGVTEISEVLSEVERLRREIGETPPWDAPTSCRCSARLAPLP